MKYKYKLMRNNESKQLIIQEYIRIEGEMLFLVCEETYEIGSLKNTLHKGSNTLKNKLRNRNIYPPSGCMTSLVSAVTKMLTTDKHQNSLEINFDDKEINARNNRHGNKDSDSNNVEVNKGCLDVDKLLEDDPVEVKKNQPSTKE